MAGVTWIQLDKTLGYNKVLATTTSVEIDMSEKYSSEQSSLNLQDILEIRQVIKENGDSYYPVSKNGKCLGYINKNQATKIINFPTHMAVIEKKYVKNKHFKIKLDLPT